MKTRLLKKIRKQYSIVYYPNGFEPSNVIRVPNYPLYYVDNVIRGSIKQSKKECIDWILERVREKYQKHSRKCDKNKYKGIKVWYNG